MKIEAALKLRYAPFHVNLVPQSAQEEVKEDPPTQNSLTFRDQDEVIFLLKGTQSHVWLGLVKVDYSLGDHINI